MSSSSGAKCFSETPADLPFVKFVDFACKEICRNVLATKTLLNDYGGKYKKEFNFRFRGEESFLYMKHFSSSVKMLFVNITENAKKTIN